jgi:hypothetical protein
VVLGIQELPAAGENPSAPCGIGGIPSMNGGGGRFHMFCNTFVLFVICAYIRLSVFFFVFMGNGPNPGLITT